MRLSYLLFLFVFLGYLWPATAGAQAPSPYPWPVNWQDGQNMDPERRDRDTVKTRDTAPSRSMERSHNKDLNEPPPNLDQGRYQDFNHDLNGGFAQNPLSPVENMYQSRVVDPVRQFGYDLFGVPAPHTRNKLDRLSGEVPPSGAVGDDFVLNSGDEIEVVFTGQRTDRGIYKITRQGLLLIEDFPPIPAAGRKMAQLRLSIQSAAENMHNTEAYVSLASVRQIGVLVIGHVERPGRQTLTVFHTVLDALMAAGGVRKDGSLRAIKLVRGGRSTLIDLYGLLIHGSTNMDFHLQDGDRIIVPSIGPTVAVSGEVKRPGIFEIESNLSGMYHQHGSRSEKLSLNDMLAFAGGVLSPGRNRFVKLGLSEDGRENVTDIDAESEAFDKKFGDGAILMVAKGQEKRAGMIELTGHTRSPGLYALSEYPNVSRLLTDETLLGPDIYSLTAMIERWDQDHLAETRFLFPLRLVLKEKYDRKLKDGDVIHLFSMSEIKDLQQNSPSEETNKITEEGSRNPDPRNIEDVPEQNQLPPEIKSYLREHAAFIRGAVRQPGAYPVAEGVTLDSIIAAAGGLSLEADTTSIEVTPAPGSTRNARRQIINFRDTRPENVTIGPGDHIRIHQKFKSINNDSVLVLGEVRSAGHYDLVPGDRISDLLQRAGGLTPHAYPEGAIFSRASERRAEELRFQAQARQIQQSIAAALESEEDDVNSAKIAEARALAAELEGAQGVGRITVEADPAVLAAQPEVDMLLEPGDRLYIPRRNLSVRVRGEVLSPAALQFREGKSPRDYIEEAGGFGFHADKSRTFVLYPDGAAQPLQVSAWNHRATFIPPGSTIVVPRDPKPFDFVQSAKDISQILSNLAITAIFIDDVRDD